MPRLVNANSTPGSATSTRHFVCQVRSGVVFVPVNEDLLSSCHSPASQTGLHSPIRVMSETRAYTASGAASMTMVSVCWYGVVSMPRSLNRGHLAPLAAGRRRRPDRVEHALAGHAVGERGRGGIVGDLAPEGPIAQHAVEPRER